MSKQDNEAFRMIQEDHAQTQDNKQEVVPPSSEGEDNPGDNPNPSKEGGEGGKPESAANVTVLDNEFRPITEDKPGENGNAASKQEPVATDDPEPIMEFGSRVKELLGGMPDLKSDEDHYNYIQSVLSGQGQSEEVREELNRKQTIIQELQEKLSGQDSELLAATQFKKDTGIADHGIFTALKDLDVDNMGNQQAIEMMSMIKNPALSKEDLKFKMERKYLQGEDVEEADRRLGEIEMKGDSYEARNFLRDLKGKITTPENDFDVQARESEIEQELTQLKENWDSAVETSFAKVENPKFDIDGSSFLEMSLQPNEVEEMKDIAWEYAIENNLDPQDPESYKEIGNFVQNMYIGQNFNKMLRAAYEQGQHDTQIKDKKEIHNPSALHQDNPDQKVVDTSDMSDKAFEWANRKV